MAIVRMGKSDLEGVRWLWPTEKSGLPRCSYYELWWRFLRLSSRLLVVDY